MKVIELVSEKDVTRTTGELNKNLDEVIDHHQNTSTYFNSLASSSQILSGAIEYFDKLGSHFLGSGNASGIPSEKADHFANNFYRLTNSIKYLAKLWKLDITEPKQIKLLKDIRTLIVHSGEQVSQVKSLELKDYKDSQLGRIFHRENHDPFLSFKDHPHMDYRIQIWNDKHDKKKKQHLSEVDYHLKNKSFYDLSIYLNASDVKNIVLSYIENFLDNAIGTKPQEEPPKLPDIKNRVIIKEDETIDFDKLANLVSKDLRGGYIKENNIEYWDGYGLKRLYEYAQKRTNISDEVRQIIVQRVKDVISKYWDDYENEDIEYHEITTLDIRNVFSDYTPVYDYKNYLEGEKLFYKIAPFFNAGNRCDSTDIDYLDKFIKNASAALGVSFNLEQTVDHLICDYIVQSIQVKKNHEK